MTVKKTKSHPQAVPGTIGLPTVLLVILGLLALTVGTWFHAPWYLATGFSSLVRDDVVFVPTLVIYYIAGLILVFNGLLSTKYRFAVLIGAVIGGCVFARLYWMLLEQVFKNAFTA